jgi:hypothetical protein
MRKSKLTEDQVTLEMVKVSDFGCPNCLYYGIECRNYDKFAPRLAFTGVASCRAYAYCD